jgi:hypothetical protein
VKHLTQHTPPMRAPSPARWICLCLIALFAAACTPKSSPHARVAAAWSKAVDAAHFSFDTTIEEQITPLPMLINAGSRLRSTHSRLAGSHDATTRRTDVSFWPPGAAQPLRVRIENGRTFHIDGADNAAADLSTFSAAQATAEDGLGFLAAARNVQFIGVERRTLADGTTLEFERYRFSLDAAAYAAHLRTRLTAHGAASALPATIEHATGSGELWLDARGFPRRISVSLALPPDARTRTSLAVRTDLHGFPSPPNSLISFSAIRELLNPRAQFALAFPDSPTLAALGFFALALLGLHVRRLRPLWTALIVCGLLGSPLREALLPTRPTQAQSIPATAPSIVDTRPTGIALRTTAPAAASENLDSDGDSLTDAQEVRLGLDPLKTDSDGDGLFDDAEVLPFRISDGASLWNTDPRRFDSDGDGQPDGLECPQRAAAARAPCVDSDGDGTPDVFDADSDADGVDDVSDAARLWPLADAGRFDDAAPLALSVAGARTPGSRPQPLFVDFQIRPRNPAHLHQALNVLDWPADELGQIRRKPGNDATFADIGGAGPHDANGDLRLMPLLEIEIPHDAHGYGNLPVKPNAPPATISNLADWLDQDALAAYGISVRYHDDLGNLVAYVPLQIVTDPVGDRRIAFSARMPYRPISSQWGAPHAVRLVWALQALIDRCEPNQPGVVTSDPNTRCENGAGAWAQNEMHIVHTYSEPWTLTGLSVRQDFGASALVIHENPAHAGLAGDSLWALAAGLDRSFLDGASAMTLDEIAQRWTPADDNVTSDEKRWNLARDAFAVHRYAFSHGDEIARLSISETSRILDLGFAAATAVTATTLLIAREETGRSLDVHTAAFDGTLIRLDLAAAVSDTVASLSWAPFRRAAGSWQPYPLDDFLDLLDDRTREQVDAFDVADDDPDRTRILDGQSALIRGFYAGLAAGRSSLVRIGAQPVFNPLRPHASDAVIRANIQSAGGGVRAVVTELSALAMEHLPALRGADRASTLRRFALVLGASYSGVRDEAVAQLHALKRGFLNSGARYTAFTGLAAAALLGAVVWTSLDSSRAAQGIARLAAVGMQGYSVYAAATAFYSAARGGLSLTRTAGWIALTNQVAAKATVVGSVVGLTVMWGMLAWAVASNRIAVGTLEGNAFVAGIAAQSMTLVLMAAISLIPIAGQLIVAVVGLIDAVLSLVCWAAETSAAWCGGVSGYVTSAMQWLLFSQNVMVDLAAPDRLRIGEMSQRLADRRRGASPGQLLTTRLALTNTLRTIEWADTNYDWKAGAYWWQYDADAIKSSAFRYALDADPRGGIAPTRDSMRAAWRGDGAPFTMRVELTGSAVITLAGIDRPATPLFFLHEGYAVPTQECWAVPAAPLLPIVVPVCVVRTKQGVTHIPLGRVTTLDIFPATLDEFLALQPAADGFRLAWDVRFPRLRDADGDGLLTAAVGGPDPDDARADADGDGLDDFAEIRAGGDPLASDADADCLSDFAEQQIGTSPRAADTDADGLSDFAEAALPGAFCNATGDVAGWLVSYGTAQDGTPLALRVRSDPLDADADADGWLDAQERAYGFHPAVADGSAALHLSSLLRENDAASDNVLRPGQPITFIATLANDLEGRMLRGVLESRLPLSISGQLAPAAFALSPGSSTAITGALLVATTTASGPATLLQEARGDVFDWRSRSGMTDVRLPFDETSATGVFRDASGVLPAADAVCAGSCPTLQTSGPRGGSLTFDGVDDGLRIAADSAPLRRAEFTVAAWVRPTSCDGCTQRLLHRDGDLELTIDMSPGVRRLAVRRPGYAPLYGRTQALSLDTWQHIAVTLVEGGGRLAARFFVDGTAAGEDSAVLTDAIPPRTPAPLFIGRAPEGAFYRGGFDDLHLFPRALDAGAIAALISTPILDLPGLRVDGVDGAPRALFFTDPRYSLRGGAFTQAVWVQPRRTTPRTQPLALLLGDELPRRANSYPGLYQLTDDPNDIIVGFGDGCGWREFRFADVLALDRWQHLAATYDANGAGPGRGRYLLYVDGDVVGSADREGSSCFGLTYSPVPDTKFLVSVAPRPDGATAPVRGLLHSPSIYARALSSADVASLHRSDAAVFSFPLDDAAGSTLFRDDAQSAVALCIPPACPTAGALGRIDDAVFFDGDDILSVRIDTPPSAYAVSFWMLTTESDAEALFEIDGGRILSLSGGAICSSSRCASETPLTGGSWRFIAYSVDGDGIEHIYVDGILRASGPTQMPPSTGTALRIGSGFRGALDDVRMLRRPFTDADITATLARAPALRMRLNEAADATAFTDDAGNTPALCGDTGCPRAGIPGRIGTAAYFTGTSTLVFAAPSSAERSFTFEAWVRPQRIDAEARILGTSDATGSGLFLSPDGSVAFRTRSMLGELLALTTTSALLPERWSHLAVAFDGEHARLYVNGAPRASANAPTGFTLSPFSPLILGTGFVGGIDEVRLYTHSQLATEIAQRYGREAARIEATARRSVFIDAAPPRSQVAAHGAFVAPGPLLLSIIAQDDETSVSHVEIGVDGVFSLAPPCADALGQAWCPTIELASPGEYRIQARATDRAGNVETPLPPAVVTVDAAPPSLSADFAAHTDLTPTAQADGSWTLDVQGAVVDADSGVADVSVEVLDATGTIIAGRRTAAVMTNRWSIAYPLDEREPNGPYTVRAHAVDHVGNASSIEHVLRIDAYAPLAQAGVHMPDAGVAPQPNAGGQVRPVITDAAFILTGTVNDPGPGVGPAFVEAALVLAMPGIPWRNDSPAGDEAAYLTFDDAPQRSGHSVFRDVIFGRTTVCRTTCPFPGESGYLGAAVAFDRRSAGIELGGLSLPANGSTVTFWLRTSSTATTTLVALVGASALAEQSIFLAADGRLCASFRGASTCRAGMLNDGQWHHIALVAASGSTPRLFVDGAGTTLPALPPTFGAALTATIGSAAEFTLDEMHFFTSAFSDNRVRSEYDDDVAAHTEWSAARTPAWVTATLASDDTWQIPGLFAGRQGYYRLDLRSTDRRGNVRTQENVWSGVVDTMPPTLHMNQVLYFLDYSWRWLDIGVHASDPNLDTASLRSPCDAGTPVYETEFRAGWHRSLAGTGMRKIVALSTGCPSYHAFSPDGLYTSHVCDVYGNCTTTTLTPNWEFAPERGMSATRPISDDVGIIDPASGRIFTTLAAVPLTVTAASLERARAITLFVDGVAVGAQEFADVAASVVVTWTTAFTPSTAGVHTLTTAVRDGSGQVTTSTQSTTVYVDLAAPTPNIAAVITSTDLTAAGIVHFHGTITDDASVRSVTVTIDGDAAPTTLDADGRWRASWTPNSQALPDGRIFSVTVQAADIAGRTAVSTAAVFVDVTAPAAVELTMTTIITGALQMSWTAPFDGSGPVSAEPRWRMVDTSTETVEERAGSTTFVTTRTGAVYAHLVLRDGFGNERRLNAEQTLVVDGPLTPDYAPLRDMSGFTPHTWRTTGCSLLDIDRRPTSSGRPSRQNLFATWDERTLRLAFDGANWDVDGALFIYLDTLPGGAAALYDPYDAPPPVTMTLPTTTTLGQAMAADYVVYIPSTERAELMRWDGARWQFVRALTADEFIFAGMQQGSTDLAIPFDAIGVSTPGSQSLALLVLAAEEKRLGIWSAFPIENPLTSGPSATSSDGPLPFRYAWPALTDNACPNGTGAGSAALTLDVAVEPTGAVFRLVGDRLAPQFSGNEDAAARAALSTRTSAAPAAAGDVARYVFTMTNAGDEPLQALSLTITTDNFVVFGVPPLGTLGVGEQRTVVVTGVIGAAAEYATAAVRVVAHDRPQPLLEAVWIDQRRDLTPPTDFGIDSARSVHTSGLVMLHGFAYDASGVPELQFEMSGGGRTETTVCVDVMPHDGQWACEIDLFRPSSGMTIAVRLRAADGAGLISAWSHAQIMLLDDVAPIVTAHIAEDAARGSFEIAGSVADDVGVDTLELCVDSTQFDDCITGTSTDVDAGEFVTAGTWFAELVLPLVDGENFTVTATLQDLAGNRSAPVVLQLTADGVPAEFTSRQSSHVGALFEESEVLRGDDAMQLRHLVATVHDPLGIERAMQVTLAANGGWVVRYTPLLPGIYEFRLQGLDRFGNATARGPFTFAVHDAHTLHFPLLIPEN